MFSLLSALLVGFLACVASRPVSLRGIEDGQLRDPIEMTITEDGIPFNRDLSSCEGLKTFDSSVQTKTLVSFYAMGDVPYSIEERYCLNGQLRDLDLSDPVNGPSFMVHVGDIKKGWPLDEWPCDADAFDDVVEILTHPSNTLKYDPSHFFLTIGDNEWTDCRDEDDAWEQLTTHFGPGNVNGFGTHIDGVEVHRQLNVERLPGVNRWENFAFFQEHVLFIGINMIGGDDIGDEHVRIPQNYDWVEENMAHYSANEDLKAVVIFGHAQIMKTKLTYFGVDFFKLLEDVYPHLPVMYLHGDYHDYCVHYPMESELPNFVDVEVEDGGYAPPLLVSVIMNPNDGTALFEIDERGGLYEDSPAGSCPLTVEQTWTAQTPSPTAYDPFALVYFEKVPDGKLSVCQGDCDNDKDCQDGLECFKRDEYEQVPGCNGDGIEGKDYCIYENKPDPVTTPTPPPTDAPTPSPTVQVTTTPPTDPPVATNKDAGFPPLTYKGKSPDEILGECEGDCDRDKHCGDGLFCYSRGGYDPVPGCSGNDVKGNGNVRGKDYCIPEYYRSTPSPSPKPTTESVFNLKALDLVDEDDSSELLGECQGDCDSHSDCKPGLFCKQRGGRQRIPGCVGRENFRGEDFCYRETSLQDVAEDDETDEKNRFLGPCQGDCDSHRDCKKGLKCFKRRNYESVPGCPGLGTSGNDYCYRPLDE